MEGGSDVDAGDAGLEEESVLGMTGRLDFVYEPCSETFWH